MFTTVINEGPFRRAWAGCKPFRAYGLAVLSACTIAIGLAPTTAAAKTEKYYRLSGPYTQKNLAIYLIHRKGRNSVPVPFILGEAMKKGLVKVIETGAVERLMVRNLSDREVFIQAGDIVKGGKQDRVLVYSIIIPPNSDYLPIGALCVERGRWSRRGREKVGEFSMSERSMPSKGGRIAIMKKMRRRTVPREEQVRARRRRGSESLQSEVWGGVSKLQKSLSSALRFSVVDEESRSSLQLSLENKRLESALEVYEKALSELLEKHPEAVGYILAINGEISSGDEFGSVGLFRKVWPRQLKAAATQAIEKLDAPKREQPTLVEVAAFIDTARAAKPSGQPMPGNMTVETRETSKTLYIESWYKDRWVHGSLVAY